jgi:hypothetical protein
MINKKKLETSRYTVGIGRCCLELLKLTSVSDDRVMEEERVNKWMEGRVY